MHSNGPERVTWADDVDLLRRRGRRRWRAGAGRVRARIGTRNDKLLSNVDTAGVAQAVDSRQHAPGRAEAPGDGVERVSPLDDVDRRPGHFSVAGTGYPQLLSHADELPGCTV